MLRGESERRGLIRVLTKIAADNDVCFDDDLRADLFTLWDSACGSIEIAEVLRSLLRTEVNDLDLLEGCGARLKASPAAKNRPWVWRWKKKRLTREVRNCLQLAAEIAKHHVYISFSGVVTQPRVNRHDVLGAAVKMNLLKCEAYLEPPPAGAKVVELLRRYVDRCLSEERGPMRGLHFTEAEGFKAYLEGHAFLRGWYLDSAFASDAGGIWRVGILVVEKKADAVGSDDKKHCETPRWHVAIHLMADRYQCEAPWVWAAKEQHVRVPIVESSTESEGSGKLRFLLALRRDESLNSPLATFVVEGARSVYVTEYLRRENRDNRDTILISGEIINTAREKTGTQC
jgi:hypothetical protein